MTHTPNPQRPQFTPRRDATKATRTEREVTREQEAERQAQIEASHAEQRERMRTYNARPRGKR